MAETRSALTIEELARLAEIAGLRREHLHGLMLEVYRPLGIPVSQFRPDQNWKHLGMVIERMTALSFRLQLATGARVDGNLYYRAEWLGGLFAETMSGPQSTMHLAISRSALVAITERKEESDESRVST